MTTLISVLFFIFGAIIGSFLNVVILRWHTSKSLGGRSCCMSCRSTLCWYELIPIVSFLALKGRCRTCSTKISKQYPLVEFFSGLVFFLLFLKFDSLFYLDIYSFIIFYAFYALLFSILIVISFYDLRHKIIPDELSLVFGGLSFAGLFFFSGYQLNMHLPAVNELLSGLYVALPFAFFWLISGGRWMGLGDAKLALGIGWLLGVSRGLSAIVLSFWTGAIIGITLIIFSRSLGMKSEIPFAPFLAFGAIVAMLFELHLFPLL